MFFDGWSGILRMLAVGVPAYAALVLLLRIGGKRTLAKLNAFDLVVTVAFGSILATALLDATLPLADVIVAFALLVILQFIVTWSSLRSRTVDRVLRNDPTVLYERGEYLEEVMRRERVKPSEVMAAVRSQGLDDLDHVERVVLEADGSLSVVVRTR